MGREKGQLLEQQVLNRQGQCSQGSSSQHVWLTDLSKVVSVLDRQVLNQISRDPTP